MSRVLVIIPTYNEVENLDMICTRVRSSEPSAHILVADDNSPDGTGKLADTLAESDTRFSVLHRPVKAGLGAAYLAGFEWGLQRDFDVIVEMDADGSHRPEQLRGLLDELEGGADLVIGSRWIPGGQVLNWPRRREILSRGANLYVRVMLGIDVADATGGYRAFRRETLLGLDLSHVISQGYCFQVDLARRAIETGFNVAEVPITFAERVRGESKMSGNIVREALWRVTAWGIRRRWALMLSWWRTRR